jgi:hypothetical protein
MVIFENDITFDSDDTAVIWAKRIDGARVKVCVTKEYAQRTWRIPFSQEEVITKIWLNIDEFRERASRALAAGKAALHL